MKKRILFIILIILLFVCCFNFGYTAGRKKEIEILIPQMVKLELRISELETEAEDMELENLYIAEANEIMKEDMKVLSDKLNFIDSLFIDRIIPILQRMKFGEDYIDLDAVLLDYLWY